MFLGIIVLVLVVGVLVVFGLVRKRKDIKRGWKIKRADGARHTYSEIYHGKWRSIEINGETYAKGLARHAVYLPPEWSEFPTWAREKKDIIIARIHEELKPPTYTIIEKN